MKTLFQKTRTAIVLSGSVALLALMTATPVVPAHAQGVPAGLLRLDPPQFSSNAQVSDVERPHAKARNHSRKIQAHQ